MSAYDITGFCVLRTNRLRTEYRLTLNPPNSPKLRTFFLKGGGFHPNN